VEGAAANGLPDPVPDDTKQERYERFMELAGRISAAKLAEKVGRTMRVIVDSVGQDGAVARSSADAPEIDGVVRIARPGPLKAGDWADVEITRSDAYDLDASISRRT
jgi:ribosomal protein S12 methylthiotransferase